MKKLIIALLLVALTLGLCACGASDTQKPTEEQATQVPSVARQDFEAASTYIESLIDTNEMSKTDQDDENGLYRYWTYSGKEANNTFSPEIEIDGKKITLGETTVNDLKELGFECEIDVETVQPNTEQGFIIRKDNKYCNISVQNTTEKEQSIHELAVFQINVLTDSGFLDFNYGDIKSGSTLEDVIKALGTPRSNITLSGAESGASIALSYSNIVTDGDLETISTLDIDLPYQTEKNTADVRSINLSVSQNKIPQETTG